MTESQTIEFIQYGLPKPIFEYTWTAVVATFYKIIEIDEGVNEGVNGGVNGGVEYTVYNFILKNPNFNAKQISEKTNIPLRSTERWIKQLKNENKIKFEGSPKTGGYQAITNNKYTKEL